MKWWILFVMMFVWIWYGQVDPAAIAPAPLPVADESCIPGEVLLDLSDGASFVDAQSVVAGLDVEIASPDPILAGPSIFKVIRHGASQARTVELAAELAKRPGVQTAEPNWVRRALYAPNDPLFKHQWHMRMVRAPETWDLVTGKGIVVAVLDTGIAYGKDPAKPSVLRDLKGVEMLHPRNTLGNNDDANDRHGHGSHVAGTIAQNTHNKVGVVGVAYGAKLMPVKVLSDGGSGSMESVVKGIYWAADHGAHVINMSLGSRQGAQIEEDAVTYAFKKGVFVACAAGNEGGEQVNYPAACKDAVAIAAVRFDRTRTFYSSYGAKVALSAPGGDTRVDQDKDGMPDGVFQNTVRAGGKTEDFFMFQGTSMATPHVAGAAALVMSAGEKDPAKVLKILQATATKVEGNARGMGAGVIDVYAAVKKVGARKHHAGKRGNRKARRIRTLLLIALVLGLGALHRRNRSQVRGNIMPTPWV